MPVVLLLMGQGGEGREIRNACAKPVGLIGRTMIRAHL